MSRLPPRTPPRGRLSRRDMLALAAAGVVGCSDKNDTRATTGGVALPTWRVSAIPDENPTELMRKFEPLIDFLKRELGGNVTYVPVTDYGAAVQALAGNKIDFAWLGAFTYVQASHQAKVEPLCMRAIDRNFQSVFIVNAAAEIADMKGLAGKAFAFGSKSSTSGHLMPRHFLKKLHKLDPEKDFSKVTFTGSHDATVKLVESGQVGAGAVNKLVWDRMVAAGQVDKESVKLLWTTPGFVDYVWAARTAVPEDIRKKFKAAFLGLKPGAGDAVLKLQDAKQFVAASPADFKAVEQVAIATGLLKP